jgi:hypothetical protein
VVCPAAVAVRPARGLIAERIAAAPPPFAAVRSRVLHELLDERSEARLRAALQALRAGYDVRIDGRT